MRGGKSKAAATNRKRKAVEKEDTKAKRGKAGKDAGKPKRPPSAFFVFMEGFRKDFQEKNPDNKRVSIVSKAGGDKWKSMSEADKAPYVAEAAKRKAEYEDTIASYNKKQSEGSGDNASAEEDGEGEEGSDKSKSEVDDDEDENGEEEEEEDEE